MSTEVVKVEVICDNEIFNVLFNDKLQLQYPIITIKDAIERAKKWKQVETRLQLEGDMDNFNIPARVIANKRVRTPNMDVLIKDVNERDSLNLPLNIDNNDTILDIKYLISESINLPVNVLRLYHNPSGSPSRQPLYDHQIVKDVPLRSGTILTVMYCFPSNVDGHGEVHRTVPNDRGFVSNNITEICSKFRKSVTDYRDKPFLGTRHYNKKGTKVGSYRWITYAQAGELVSNVGSGLINLCGVTPGTSVGIMSPNRVEWLVSDLACACQSFISVPLYDTLGPTAVKYIVEHANIHTVIVCIQQLKAITEVRHECPSLKYIIVMDQNLSKNDKKLLKEAKENNEYSFTFTELVNNGKSQPHNDNPPNAQDIYTICYTSGTTGNPKGVMLTHENIVRCAESVILRIPLDMEGPDETLMSYLPLAHIYERATETMFLQQGHRIGYFQGDTTKLVEDVVALQPTMFPGVPRVWQRIYDKVRGQVDEGNFISRFLFNQAFASKLEAIKNGDDSPSMWDSLVFSKVAAKFGGRLKMLLSGAAPLSNDVARFLRICMTCRFGEGYGLSETAGALCTTSMSDFEYGQVGTPLSCVEVKLVDVPEMEYLTTDKPCPRGEVWARGAGVFKGYFKAPEKTDEVLQNGWFRTGDVGMWLPNGNLKIIDRAKNIFKLSQGEYIRPEYIEGVYKQSKFVANIFVYGDSFKNYLVAVVVPDFEALESWANANGLNKISSKPDKLIEKERVRKMILDDMNHVGKNSGLKGFEAVKNITLKAQEFSVDNGILTPTFKLKRHQAKLIFANEIETMYNQPIQSNHKSKL